MERCVAMRIRKQPLGDRNIVGAKVEQSRKAIGMKQKDLLTQLQVRGIDLNASGLSKLEGHRKGLNRIQSYIRDSIENIAIF